MRFSVSSILFFLSVALIGCALNAEDSSDTPAKINGVSYAAFKVLIDSTDLVSIKKVGANWITLMPYAFIREGGIELNYNASWQWKGETIEGIKKEIKTCQLQGLKVMLKPHVWFSHGEYTGDFKLTTEADWLKFEDSYSKYILDFASVAESKKVEMYCIGTEWRLFVNERPYFWGELIKEVRKVYSGKITYASNWDEYTETPFWRQLDYIGVNAYFPLTEKKNPNLEEVLKGWEPISNNLESFSIANDKPILFTEYGYRSIEGTSIKPWISDTEAVLSMPAQEIALEALYESNWNETWFAGGFLWKWFNTDIERGVIENTGYTPQNKPSALVVKKYYDIEK